MKIDLSGKTALVTGASGGLGRVLAKEVGEHNITINEVAPGWTLTDKERAKDDETLRQSVANYVQTVPRELPRLIEVGASCFNHYCTGYDDT